MKIIKHCVGLRLTFNGLYWLSNENIYDFCLCFQMSVNFFSRIKTFCIQIQVVVYVGLNNGGIRTIFLELMTKLNIKVLELSSL